MKLNRKFLLVLLPTLLVSCNNQQYCVDDIDAIPIILENDEGIEQGSRGKAEETYDESLPYITLDYGNSLGIKAMGKSLCPSINVPTNGFNPNALVNYDLLPEFYKSTKVFGGWYLDAECTQPLKDNEDNILPNGTILYARWRNKSVDKSYSIKSVIEWDSGWVSQGNFNYQTWVEIPDNVTKLKADCYCFQLSNYGITILEIFGNSKDGKRARFYSDSDNESVIRHVDLDVTYTPALNLAYGYKNTLKEPELFCTSFKYTFTPLEYRQQIVKIA